MLTLSRGAICLWFFMRVGGAAVDLGITDDQTYKRPNSWGQNRLDPNPVSRILNADAQSAPSRPGVSIAWRNANQVEEVEVGVRNAGNEAGEGHVFVDVLDETAKILLHLEPPEDQKVIRLPAANQGGLTGKVIRMKASWALNTLIDRFDRTRTRYDVRATIVPVGVKDDNPLDNSKTKSWNIPFRVRPGLLNVYNYTFKNHDASPVMVKWHFEHTPYPAGWQIREVPADSSPFELKPGQEIAGALTMLCPKHLIEGDFVEARLALIRVDDGTIFQQKEWFQVYDTEPPHVSNYRVVLMDDHRIAIQALVADKGSGVLEATGVTTEYSVDAGRTWAKKAHNYKVGNFVRPTLFETVLGPFAPGTSVQLRFSAMDTGGNIQTIIPQDATAFEAPPNARKLLEQAYVFPRTQQNPVFDLEKLKRLQLDVKKLRNANVDIANMDLTRPNALNIDPVRLRELNMDARRLQDLREDLSKIGDLDLDIELVKPFDLKRVNTPADTLLTMSTIEVQVK